LLNESLGKVNDDERREFLGNIMISGKHLLGLINEVLGLSRIEAGRVTLSRKPFSVAEVLQSVRKTVEPLADKKRITIATTVDLALPPLTADETKFKQILYNLLSNAIKFTPEAGQVHVRAQANNESVQISVRDTGIGIKPEDRERIFQEFEQVETSFERRFEGTGLGLTLAKKLVELQGGKIWLESELGEGSTFAFSLPLSSDCAPH
jgi:signal transduction histidine kinase